MPGEPSELQPPPAPKPPRSRAARLGLGVAFGVLVVVGLTFAFREFWAKTAPAVGSPPPGGGGPAEVAGASPEVRFHPVDIRKPSGPPVFHTGIKDAKGNPVTMSCADCHRTREPNPDSRLGTPTPFFHQTVKGPHGNLSCVSCHNPADAHATLRLADGKPLPYTEVMQLCAQCHGPQHRDYLHGAHGGMTGHWDLTRGGRTRANCIDCHNPHAPKYPTVQPVKGPNDRGGAKETGHE